ncbi:MAG: VPLPA-CTERM sorting domain-containing protein [Cypionkella sp.]
MTLGAAFTVASLAIGSFASAATIVQNGSFEVDPGVAGDRGLTYTDIAAGTGGGWDIYDSLPGWAADTDGVEVQTKHTIPLTPFDGDYYVELDTTQNSGISQTVTLGVGKYLMSFAYSPRIASVTTNAISYGIDTLFGSIVNGPGGELGTVIGEWTVITKEFVVTTAGDYSMFFDATFSSDSLGGFVDNVQIAAVPVPAAGFLLFGALGGLAALRRRKSVTV